MTNHKRNLALSKLDEIETMIDCFRSSFESDDLSSDEKDDICKEIDKLYDMLTDTTGKES
jgi:hypothetical protein